MMSTRTTLKSGQTVFDPRGTVTAAALTLAPRVETLQGTRLGVLDNSKWNASKLLRATVARLQSESPPSGGVLMNSFSAPHNRHTPGLVAPLAVSIIQWCTWGKVNSDLLIPLRL